MDPGRTMTLANLKEWNKNLVNAMRDQKLINGFTDPYGTTWGTTPADITNLSGVCVLIACGAVTSNQIWRDLNNVDHVMTPPQLIQLAGALAMSVRQNYVNSWTHKANIDALQTIADVHIYDITTGWSS